ncbi:MULTISPECIES: SDR family oxidoreductase [Kaistia]|uniref:SDR family oxidoreductase n=1 Tax=Kaistia nematophila TaxID=2994654 RepID=A0A9X3ILQ5_9HYPH|nr:SDR family oxidoreductase [Kaistia nematophila]MCX5569781.1 SDR family oxidoreductase [Kaistia nematophila]
MTGRLTDKVAIVTGAARGIGAAIARAFAAEGAQLGLVDIDADGLAAFAAELGATGARPMTAVANIGERAAVEAAVAAILARHGRVDVLVNNAGINVFADPLELSDEAWQRCMAVNLEGAWHMIRAVLPAMLAAGRGAIVNIASTHAFSIIPGTFPYPVAKHGLLGLTRALAVDYAPQGIRINAIAPGYIETDKVRDWLAEFPDPAAARARIEGLIPLRRIGTPEQVAHAAVFLASDESAFSTGSVLTMDGGRSVVYHD